MLQDQGNFVFKLVSSWRINELYSTPNTIDVIGNIDKIIEFLEMFHNVNNFLIIKYNNRLSN